MNKFIKISLVASIAVAGLTSNSLAADNLAEAFSNGKFKGALKSYYFAKTFENPATNDPSIWVNGGSFNYVTDSFNGLTLGATFQTSHVGKKNDSGGTYINHMDASGSVLSESYIKYKFSNTALKAGRQFIATPLILGSGSRMIKEAFEAYLVTNTDIPDTTIVAGKVTKYQTRTDAAGGISKFAYGRYTSPDELSKNGINTIYIKNNSVKNLTLQAQYADFEDMYATLYIDGKYNFDGEIKPFVALQYYDTDYDSADSKDNSMFGMKAGVNINGLDLFAGYTSTGGQDGDAGVKRGIGQGAYKTFTATGDSAGWKSYGAGTDSWQIGAAYSFGKLSTKLRYSNFDVPAANQDLDEINLNLGYKFSGKFKNLKASVGYSMLDYEVANGDNNTLQTKLIYSF